jgi:hypothetical protein
VAKITRKRLARGTKLMPEHVYTPLADAKAQLEGINIEREQMQAPTAPFCVNLTLPYLSHETSDTGTLSIPFALPPLQENFLSNGVYDPAAPKVSLRSVSFSWDQRAEPAAIASQFWRLSGSGTADTGKYGYSSEQGKITYDDVHKMDIMLAIHDKDQYWLGNAYPHRLQRELWSITLPASAFSDSTLRANPFIQGDIGISIDPHKTFVFTVSCPGLEDTTGRFLALPSIEVSMKFDCELIERDSGSTIQNIPDNGGSGSSKYGAKTAPSVTITAPSSGSAIEADSSDGVEYNITAIDDQFRDKLEGGYNRYGDVPPTETIKHDAAYDVIAVPIFQNAANGGITANPTFSATWPYVGTRTSPTANRGLFDRRIVPIHHSYTIHHAILAWNWTPYWLLGWDGTGTKPMNGGGSPTATAQQAHTVCPSGDIGLKVGVGIGTGLKGDDFGYLEVAELAITDPNRDAASHTYPRGWGVGSTLVDRITTSNNPPGTLVSDGAGGATVVRKWNWELHSIPLVQTGTDAGTGYYSQGKPAFAGPGWTTTQARQALGGVTADNRGAEQWIEVRALLHPTDATKSLATTVGTFGNTLADYGSLLVGYGGCYVYLICKKTLTK